MFPTYFSGHYVPVDLIMYEWKISVVFHRHTNYLQEHTTITIIRCIILSTSSSHSYFFFNNSNMREQYYWHYWVCSLVYCIFVVGWTLMRHAKYFIFYLFIFICLSKYSFFFVICITHIIEYNYRVKLCQTNPFWIQFVFVCVLNKLCFEACNKIVLCSSAVDTVSPAAAVLCFLGPVWYELLWWLFLVTVDFVTLQPVFSLPLCFQTVFV